MKAAKVDSKRRIVLPAECPPRALVTIEQLDEYTWLIKRQRPATGFKMVLIPVIKKLPGDPEWEKVEARIGRHIARRLPEPKD